MNGSRPGLHARERIRLVDNGRSIATPSGPDPDHDGFNVCTYRSFCPAPPSG